MIFLVVVVFCLVVFFYWRKRLQAVDVNSRPHTERFKEGEEAQMLICFKVQDESTAQIWIS